MMTVVATNDENGLRLLVGREDAVKVVWFDEYSGFREATISNDALKKFSDGENSNERGVSNDPAKRANSPSESLPEGSRE